MGLYILDMNIMGYNFQQEQLQEYYKFKFFLLLFSSMSAHSDPLLPSLGASLGSEFDAFGADNLNLTKLLGSDTVGSPWGDPFADHTGSITGSAGSSSNQSQYPIRPWELDQPSAVGGGVVTSSLSSLSSAGGQTTSTVTAATTNHPPPNVLAPPSNASLPGLPRMPTHTAHHPTAHPHPHAAAAQYFHRPAPTVGPTYIDQRLPSFQSQFQPTPDPAAAAAFHVPAPHYSLGELHGY